MRNLCLITVLAVQLVPRLAGADRETARKDPNTPVLKTRDTQQVLITHPALDAKWTLEIPEAVGSADVLVFYPPINLDNKVWNEYDDGTIGYDWEPDAAAHKRVRGRERFDAAVGVSVRLKPSPDRIDLAVYVKNVSNRDLKQVWSDGGCLSSGPTARFHDLGCSRVFLKTTRGIMPCSETRRTRKVWCAYVFSPAWYDTPIFTHDPWGRSDTCPTSAFLARQSRTGGGAIGIGYEQAMKLMQNSDGHQCMHSGPFYGTLKPGEQKVRRGIVLFGDTVEEVFKSFEPLGYAPVETTPE